MAAKQSGATVIEVNPEESALTPYCVDIFLQGPSGRLLAELLEALKPKTTG